MEKNNVTIEQVTESIKNMYSDMELTFDKALVGQTDFRVNDIHCTIDSIIVKLAIYLDEKKEKIARWNTLEFRLEEDLFETGNGRKFVTNIGTTGDFDLDDKSKGSRKNFYIQVGKVLGDEIIMGIIKNGMTIYGISIRETREQLRNLREKEV